MAEGAIERASAYLLARAEEQFAEARHQLTFPHSAGFTGQSERQSGDLFARATLANLLLDVAELWVEGERGAAFAGLAAREADYLAGAKLRDRAGGWSYFPGLPELPPDADSLAAVLSLFVRVAPEHAALCDEPVECALAGSGEDGSLETWIVASSDPPHLRARMLWSIANCWGRGTDPDVLAHFCHALFLRAKDRYADAIRRGVSRLIGMQEADGSFTSTWYTGRVYGTGLAARLLRETGQGAAARERARRFVLDTQHPDGGWGDPVPTALETALAMSALVEAGDGGDGRPLALGRDALLGMQQADGSWPASPWIRMEIGRATGKILRVLTYQSVAVTTAFCLRAVALAGRCGWSPSAK
jgi:squalene-hopene/tetraprenyl-beta-curcumene cyclase